MLTLLYDHNKVMVSPNGGEQSHYPPNYNNLTYYHHEVQCHKENIGKQPSSSSNMNVVSSIEDHGQIVQNHPSSSSSSSSSPRASYFLGNINLNGRLSKKTIEEVWKEIIHHEVDGTNNNNNNNQSVVVQQQQQLTVGETIIEDFLLRAGVINNINMGSNSNNNQNGVANHHQPFMGIDPMVVVSQQADWLQFQMAETANHHHQQQQQQTGVMDTSFNVSESSSVYENPDGEIWYSESSTGFKTPVPAAPSSESRVNNNVERKRRYSDEIMEKTIERKQKRMIKNRESAARSRARKQAYTNQLESRVLWLRKNNSWLEKQKEVEILLSSYPTPMSKHQLRRASSV